jgi:hypothetical protein
MSSLYLKLGIIQKKMDELELDQINLAVRGLPEVAQPVSQGKYVLAKKKPLYRSSSSNCKKLRTRER